MEESTESTKFKKKPQSEKEKKIRSITHLYYSRPDIQKAIFDFSKNREISPRFFEGFGKRPDSFQFKGDVFQMVRKGATSFHCSEEIWSNPLDIKTGMSKEDSNKLRTGWDLLIDIDCEEGMDYSARVAKATIESLRQNGVKNIGIKFSGSKGFHVIVPWKAFPKNINGIDTSAMFPELPRILMAYLRDYSRKILKPMLPDDFYEKFKDKIEPRYKCKKCGNFADDFRIVEFSCERCFHSEEHRFKMGTKGKVPKCPKCKIPMSVKPKEKFYVCSRCERNSLKFPDEFEEEIIDLYALMGLDMGLVSPRHLFRMPYSLHEKSALSSVVLTEDDLEKFIKNPNYKNKIADPLRVEVKNFMPEAEENEAAELVMQAYDWANDSGFYKEQEKKSAGGKYADFKPLELNDLEERQFPPCVKKILEGLKDGKKRALFVLINFFRSIGMKKEELEKRIYEWNEKNEEALKKGYIHSQLVWTYQRKPLLPPNCKDYYLDLGVCNPDKLCEKIKNPVSYTIRTNFIENIKKNPSKEKSKDTKKKKKSSGSPKKAD